MHLISGTFSWYHRKSKLFYRISKLHSRYSSPGLGRQPRQVGPSRVSFRSLYQGTEYGTAKERIGPCPIIGTENDTARKLMPFRVVLVRSARKRPFCGSSLFRTVLRGTKSGTETSSQNGSQHGEGQYGTKVGTGTSKYGLCTGR